MSKINIVQELFIIQVDKKKLKFAPLIIKERNGTFRACFRG